MKVLKFGGTSVGSAESMRNILMLVKDQEDVILVLSAMSGTTDSIVRIAEALHRNEKDQAKELIDTLHRNYVQVVEDFGFSLDTKTLAHGLINSHFDFLKSFTLDMFTTHEEKEVLAQGELISTALFHLLCRENSVNSVLLPALDFMRLDEHGEPDQDYIARNLKRELELTGSAKLFITQGYICRNAFGEIDNLKRGGSDYSATLIGAAVGAEEVQIWTDINGIHNNDPRYVENTYPIYELNFEEAAELAYFGAKILHPTCILPAKNNKIPVKLLNTMNPEARGTIITDTSAESVAAKAIAAKDGIVAIKIRSDRMLLAYGFLRAVFEVFERYRTPIDMITTSEVAVSLTIDDKKFLGQITEELRHFGSVEVEEGLSIICIVGNIRPETQGVAFKIFESIREIPVRMISYGGSRFNISILVGTELKAKALNLLNQGLF